MVKGTVSLAQVISMDDGPNQHPSHKNELEVGMVAHTYNLSTWEVEPEEQEVSHFQLHSKFSASLSLGYM